MYYPLLTFPIITPCQPQALGISIDTNFSPSDSGRFSVPGGQVHYTGTNEGSVATYQCDKGYSLSGSSQHVMCRSDGNWDGIIAKCVFGE